jgi:histidine ammonia-lyase
MLALLSLALLHADALADTADVAAALSLDALRGSPGAFDSRIMHARAFPGAGRTARNLAHLNEGSEIRESHRSTDKDTRVQDAYSLRCTPQVHGAVRDSLSQAREMAQVELNSATDNPLVFVKENGEGDIISGGNLHGQPLAMAADQIAIAVATRRNRGTPHRTDDQSADQHAAGVFDSEPGLNSGFMIAQSRRGAGQRKQRWRRRTSGFDFHQRNQETTFRWA